MYKSMTPRFATHVLALAKPLSMSRGVCDMREKVLLNT
jgi:hypothetical protein